MRGAKLNSFEDAVYFAGTVGVENFAQIPEEQMNAREKVRLSIEQRWILGITVEYQQEGGDKWLPNEHEFIDISSFREAYKHIQECSKVRVTGFYCYRLHNNPIEPIRLVNLSNKMPLSTQLQEYTGDSYNAIDFYSEGDENSLQAVGVIVHKKTGQRFYIPAVPVTTYS